MRWPQEGTHSERLFLLGMNDRVFPRVVREDAFLRDRDRTVLAESLGFKIDEKITGFDEEALLFALLRHSARDRVYLVYQRADEKGRPLLPSSLLIGLCGGWTGIYRAGDQCTFAFGRTCDGSILFSRRRDRTRNPLALFASGPGHSIRLVGIIFLVGVVSSWTQRDSFLEAKFCRRGTF